MKIAAVVRISQATDTTTSPEKQRANILRLCQARGWPEPVAWYEDIGVSGSREVSYRRRDDLERRLHEYDVVAFDKVDRLARSVSDFYRFAEAAERAGTALVAASEPVDMGTPFGKALVGILAIFAELEAAQIAARVRATNAHLRTEGKRGGGKRPWWLDLAPHPSGKGLCLRPNPERTALLLDAVGRLEAGASVRSIVMEWKARGIPAPHGGEWQRSTLSKLLRRPALWGGREHDGRLILGPDGLPDVDHGMAVLTLERHEALVRKISGATFTRSTDAGGLLRDMMVCPSLERMYVHHRANGRRRYVCKCDTGAVGIAADLVETYVVRTVIDRAGHLEYHVPQVVETGRDAALIAGLRRALEDARERVWTVGREERAAVMAEADELEERLTAAESVPVEESVRWVGTGTSILRTWRDAVRADDLETRRAILRSVVMDIEIQPGVRGRHQQDMNERVRFFWQAGR